MTNGIKIVTSLYELNYDEARGGSVYKSFPLTSLTIKDMIFDDFQYVIYTDKFTDEKHKITETFAKSNVEIKYKELNSKEYVDLIEPIRSRVVNSGEIWERYYSVKNYVEVILNKIQHIIDESSEYHNTIWLDAGLFGTSCNDGWRDFMVENAHTTNFINKINDKINQYGFICLRGEHVEINVDLKDKIKKHYNTDFKIVPGCLFGGTRSKIIDIFDGYKTHFFDFVQKHGELTSEQEVLSVLTHKKEGVKFYDFDNWLDLQKAFLNIMDIYDQQKYMMDSCELYDPKFLKYYRKQT